MNGSVILTWIEAIRPKTLIASIAPVMIGVSLTVSDGVFDLYPSLATLIAAVLIQIGTNLANDYYDFVRGADNEGRIGPRRVSQAGLISPIKVKQAMILSLGTAFLFGIYLVAVGGWVIALIGLVSILCAVGYTAGPFALAYNGLGDVFVFAFFGPIAVAGTYWVQTNVLSHDAILAGVGIGALTTMILVVNNMRDVNTDKLAGKNTLVVRMGLRASRLEYVALLIIGLVAPIIGVVEFDWPRSSLASCIVLLFAISPTNLVVRSSDPRVLMSALPSTAIMVGIYAILLSFGLLVD